VRCSGADLLLEQVVDGLWVGLAARRLHHLADKPADRLRILFRILKLVGILTDNAVDQCLDRRNIGDLLQSAPFDDRARIATLVPDDLEDILGDFAGDRAV